MRTPVFHLSSPFAIVWCLFYCSRFNALRDLSPFKTPIYGRNLMFDGTSEITTFRMFSKIFAVLRF